MSTSIDMRLSFYGGAREVTGACYLLETKKIPRSFGPGSRRQSRLGTKILVDCGLFQGCDECAELNFEDFKFSPKSVEAVFITHAHIDHIGRLPKLVRDGFRGKIYSTPATREIAELLLEDALGFVEREKGHLYERKDMERAIALWEEIPYHRELTVGDTKAVFRNAGHILGSGMVEIHAEGKKFLFSGDLGNVPSALLPPPDTFKDLNYLVIESTYGNREHEDEKMRVLLLERAVEDAASRGGTLMIPAFATERTQDILHLLNEMLLFRRIPVMPVFVDSPLAIRVTRVFEKYPQEYREEIQNLFREHPNLFKFKKLQMTETVEESKGINGIPPPKVIIAGSGMMQGGRILHHLKRYLPDEKSILLVVGYQAAGSLGRRLIDGEGMVKILGEDVLVRAEIRKIHGFSAHADNPQLFKFVEQNKDTLKKVFVVQGEEPQALHFMQEVKDRLGLPAEAPKLYDEFNL